MCGPGAADDIVQETFLVVLRQTGRRDAPTGSVLAYLIGIARHLVMKRHGRTSEWAVDGSVLEQRFDGTKRVRSYGGSPIDRRVRGAIRSRLAYREAIVLLQLQGDGLLDGGRAPELSRGHGAIATAPRRARSPQNLRRLWVKKLRGVR